MPAMTEQTLRVNGLDFNVAEAGGGPPVLLLHGFPDSWRLWRHQISALADAGHRVIAPDLRGFGDSAKPEPVEAYRMRTLVTDVAGHDWGASLAWVLAMFVPDRVSRLAAVSVGHPRAYAAAGLAQWRASWYMLWFQFPGVAERELRADDWAFFRRWAWNGAAPGQDPDADRQVAGLSRPGALTAGLNWYRANIDPASFVADGEGSSLPPVSCPTMGIWTSDDFALTEAQMTGSERFVTGPWRYVRLDGVDHWVPVHAPERLSQLLVDFFD
jgi:pimeloyl-ACP methyl ester carboxylesterase